MNRDDLDERRAKLAELGERVLGMIEDPTLYACCCDMTRRANPQATPPCLVCSLESAAHSLGLLPREES